MEVDLRCRCSSTFGSERGDVNFHLHFDVNADQNFRAEFKSEFVSGSECETQFRCGSGSEC